MSNKKRPFSKKIFTFLLLGSLLTIPYAADVLANSVPVEYERQESQSFPVEVKVNGPGKVTADKFEVRADEKDYPLPVDEEVTFKITPDKNGEVRTVVLNKKEDAKAVSTKTITVSGAEKKQVLEVEFVSSDAPSTGGETQYAYYFILFLFAAVFFAVAYKELKEIRKGTK